MPAHVAADPLTPFPVRLPLSIVERLRSEAVAAGVTNSHVFRTYLDLADRQLATPASERQPRRSRIRKYEAEYNKADPDLIRVLAGMANNLNQLAHQVNSSVLVGEPLSAAHILIVLGTLDEKIKALMDQNAS